MRHKLKRSVKEPVDHVGAQRERLKKKSWEGKSESYANEARERHGEAWTRAAMTDSVNITVTCRQTGVISLTQIGGRHRSSAREGQRRGRATQAERGRHH